MGEKLSPAVLIVPSPTVPVLPRGVGKFTVTCLLFCRQRTNHQPPGGLASLRVPFPDGRVMFGPQTSGSLLFAVAPGGCRCPGSKGGWAAGLPGSVTHWEKAERRRCSVWLPYTEEQLMIRSMPVEMLSPQWSKPKDHYQAARPRQFHGGGWTMVSCQNLTKMAQQKRRISLQLRKTMAEQNAVFSTIKDTPAAGVYSCARQVGNSRQKLSHIPDVRTDAQWWSSRHA